MKTPLKKRMDAAADLRGNDAARRNHREEFRTGTAYAEIKNLVANQPVAAQADGTLLVLAIRKQTNVTEMWCSVVTTTAPASTTPSADYVQMSRDPSDPNWFRVSIAVPGIPLEDPNSLPGDLASVSVTAFPLRGTTWEDAHTVVCKPYRPTTGTVVSVNARQSIWFAYAHPNYPIRTWREIGDAYRPLAIPIPSDATQVAFAANPNQIWGHMHGDYSQADGRGGDMPLDPRYAANYKEADMMGLNSWNITGISAKLNIFVIMFGGEASLTGTNYNTENAVGLDTTPIDIPSSPAPTMLYLAIHDGHEWTNNGGEIDVGITWIK